MYKTDRMVIIGGFGITILAFILAIVLATSAVGDVEPPSKVEPEPDRNMEAASNKGYANELEETPITQEMTNPINITITLTWTDEPDRNLLWLNQPDSFGLQLEGPNGQSGDAPMISNTQGQAGEVTLTMSVDHSNSNWTAGSGEWTITIVAGDAGNQERRRPALIGFQDAGNDYDMTIDWDYYDIQEGE
jgi:hypothetical protein